MLFRVKNDLLPRDLQKAKIAMTARKRVLMYNLKFSDTGLQQYLLDTYKKPLKVACLELIDNCTISYSGDELFITFQNEKYNNLAALITYGNRSIQGSNILKIVFDII